MVIGAIGIVGALHTHGIIPTFPHSFSWIEKIGTFGHGVIIGGVSLGVVVIAIGCIKSYCDKQAEKERIESQQRTYIPPGKNGEPARIRFFELSADSKYDVVRQEYASMPEGQYALHSHPSDLTKVYLVKKKESSSHLMYCEIPRTALNDVLKRLGTNVRALFIPSKSQ